MLTADSLSQAEEKAPPRAPLSGWSQIVKKGNEEAPAAPSAAPPQAAPAAPVPAPKADAAKKEQAPGKAKEHKREKQDAEPAAEKPAAADTEAHGDKAEKAADKPSVSEAQDGDNGGGSGDGQVGGVGCILVAGRPCPHVTQPCVKRTS
jgi:hypothetical protein